MADDFQDRHAELTRRFFLRAGAAWAAAGWATGSARADGLPPEEALPVATHTQMMKVTEVIHHFFKRHAAAAKYFDLLVRRRYSLFLHRREFLIELFAARRVAASVRHARRAQQHCWYPRHSSHRQPRHAGTRGPGFLR